MKFLNIVCNVLTDGNTQIFPSAFLKVNYMNLMNVIIDEELEVDSGDKSLDKIFRHYINGIFSKGFVNKIDRVFDTVLKFKDFKQRNNVMCYTQGTNIYINRPLFNSLPNEKRIKYLIHEFFHVLDNSKKFPEISKLQDQLMVLVSQSVPKSEISTFLTGKKQNIHSDWKKEVLSYLSNNSINWDIAKKGTRKAYKKFLDDSGLFNLDSYFWKKRLDN